MTGSKRASSKKIKRKKAPASKVSAAEEFQIPPWMMSQDIRPYVILQKSHQIFKPGQLHRFPWFKKAPLVIDPLNLDHTEFAEHALLLDELMFGGADLGMPRWVFYDCAILPGLVSGFAIRSSALPKNLLDLLRVPPTLEWVPLSLFIIIPMIREGHWMAHNLCSVNELIPRRDQRFKGLGFLSKAFGLWYANVQYLYGVTQWMRPAIKLHANYGFLEVVTAFTPLHTYSHSLTYRMKVESSHWLGFFDAQHATLDFERLYRPTKLVVEPQSETSLLALQKRIESGDGPFVLSGREILDRELGSPLSLYKLRDP